MRSPAAVLNRHVRDRVHGDDGVSIMELLVASAMMGLCGTVFMTAVLNVSTDVSKQANLADAGTGNRLAYQMLDKEIRYADQIMPPTDGVGSDAAPVLKSDGKGYYEYIEWHTPISSTTEQCVQWRYDSELGNLQTRTASKLVSSPSATPGAWLTVATNVSNDIKDYTSSTLFQPVFSLTTVAAPVQAQQVPVWIISKKGTQSSGNATTRSVFTAGNYSSGGSGTDVCLTSFGMDHGS